MLIFKKKGINRAKLPWKTWNWTNWAQIIYNEETITEIKWK